MQRQPPGKTLDLPVHLLGHLEVAYSLNVEDFVICFSKFTSLRLRPQVIYSDNGTNLRAGEKKLKEAVDEWFKKQDDIQIYATLSEIEWHFSPPHGPHFGGAIQQTSNEDSVGEQTRN